MKGNNQTLVSAKGAIGGSLGFPTKMPGTSYGLPAKACITGSKLANFEGTVCSHCYALRDRYMLRNAQVAQQRRLESLKNPNWIDAMIYVLNYYHQKRQIKIDCGLSGIKRGCRYIYSPAGFHRWHDSGDLQSVDHLGMICAVARNTPRIKHWLPTQESGMLREYLGLGGAIPINLVVRLSSPKHDWIPERWWPYGSSVHHDAPVGVRIWQSDRPGLHLCPAHQQDNKCGSCRACWDKGVAHVVYEMH